MSSVKIARVQEWILEGYFLIKSPRSSSYFRTSGKMKDNEPMKRKKAEKGKAV